MKKVLVISTINGIAGRNELTGIFNYVNDGHDWSIRFVQDPGDINSAALDAIVTERNSTRAVPPSGYIIQEALSFVRRHLTEGIGVDDVVKHLGVSHSLVRERFRTVYGESLRDVILDMRVKAAMSLLSRTKASVREIALKVGFSSDAHFVRYFRKKTGTTPAAYRSSSKAR